MKNLRAVFIVGNSRSGTTVMWNMLSRSRDIGRVLEANFYESFVAPGTEDSALGEDEAVRIWERLKQTQSRGLFYMVAEQEFLEESRHAVREMELAGATPGELYARFLHQQSQAIEPGSRPCEHSPRLVFSLDRLLKDFPNATVVNMVRDPRDIMVSQKNKWKRRWLGNGKMSLREMVTVLMNYHPILISLIWRGAIRTAISKSEDTRVLFVRFEDMVTQPETTMSQVCSFVGIDFSLDMLNVQHTGSSVRADDRSQKGLDKKRVQAWRSGGLNSAEIYLCERISEAEMRAVGYERSMQAPHLLHLLLSLLLFPLQALGVLFINRNRFQSLGHSVLTRLRTSR